MCLHTSTEWNCLKEAHACARSSKGNEVLRAHTSEILRTLCVNRLPSSILAGKCPFEVLYKKKPNIEHIRTIGCLCFAKRMNVHDKLQLEQQQHF